MANWCLNHVTFIGKKENISKLEQEVDRLIKVYDNYHGQLPEGFDQPEHTETATEDYIYDLVKNEVSETELSIQYSTKWNISSAVLGYIGTKYDLELTGICTEEQNRADTCGFVVGVRDHLNEIVVFTKTLDECGLSVDYIIENSGAIFSDDFLDTASGSLANLLFKLYKAAIEDASFRIEEHKQENGNG